MLKIRFRNRFQSRNHNTSSLAHRLTHMNALVGAARGEALVRLPVDVERGRGVEGELLLVLPRLRVPYDGRAVHACALQGGTSSLTHSESLSQQNYATRLLS